MSRIRVICLAFAAFSAYLLLHSCQSEESIRKAQYITNGQNVYVTRCQNCHGAKGEGLGALYPPLTDSIFLRSYRQQLPGIVKHGLSGRITVNGQQFDSEMPPTSQITPIEIAYVLTYISNILGKDDRIFSLEEVNEALAAGANGRL